MADTYSLTFDWPHTDAHSVIVTGTFDNWSSSVHLNRSDSGFSASVAVPWDSKILYKFVVDGNWVTHSNQPTESDAAGFVNNVVHTPAKPTPPPPTANASEPTHKTEVAASSAAEKPKEKVEAPVETASNVPIVTQPVHDASADILPKSDPVVSEPEASTHQPAPAAEVATAPAAAPAPEPAPASEPVPSTPPQTKSNLPALSSVPLPVTPIKTNGAHARTSTGTSTPPSSAGPSTPKTQNTFPGTDGDAASSPGSRMNSMTRKKRQSFFGKVKAVFSQDKDKKKRFGSEPRSASPSPRKSEK